MKGSEVSVGIVPPFRGMICGFVTLVDCGITEPLPIVQLSDHVKITHLALAWPERDLK